MNLRLLQEGVARNLLWPTPIVAFDIGINQAIRRLRRALNDSADTPQYIETVARRGYRLKVPLERVEKPPDPAALTGKQISHYRVLEVIGGGGGNNASFGNASTGRAIRGERNRRSGVQEVSATLAWRCRLKNSSDISFVDVGIGDCVIELTPVAVCSLSHPTNFAMGPAP
jgi:hypothetical protein